MAIKRRGVWAVLFVLAGIWGTGCISLPPSGSGTGGSQSIETGGSTLSGTQSGGSNSSGGAPSSGGTASIGGSSAVHAATTTGIADAGNTETTPCETGTERCPCFANDTCYSGLVCASHLCVSLGTGGASSSGGATGTSSSAGVGGTTAVGSLATGGVAATGGTHATSSQPSSGGATGGSGTVAGEYTATAEISTSNQIVYTNFGGGGSITAGGGDRIDKPNWSCYNVWSVWVGGNPITLSGTLPSDINYPVYLDIKGIGTINETNNVPDTYLYLKVNDTVVFDGTQAHLDCCDYDLWSSNRIIKLIDEQGNSAGGLARGKPYRIEVGAADGGTTRICVNALQITTKPEYVEPAAPAASTSKADAGTLTGCLALSNGIYTQNGYSGAMFTDADSTGASATGKSTIDPPCNGGACFTDVAAVSGVAAKIPTVNGSPDYGGTWGVVFGWNLDEQGDAGAQAADVSDKTTINLGLAGTDGLTMRVQLDVPSADGQSSTQYCANLTLTNGTAKIPLTSLVTECWQSGGTVFNPLTMKPRSVAVTVVTTTCWDTPFDFCYTRLSID